MTDIDLTGAKLPMQFAELAEVPPPAYASKRCYGHLPRQRATAHAGEAASTSLQEKQKGEVPAGTSPSWSRFLPRVAESHDGGRCLPAGLPAWQTDGGRKLRCFRAFDGLELRRIDRDAARLLGFGHDALQIDMKQAVFELGAFDFDMLGQLEFALEGAPGDALMQIGGLGRPLRACR